VTVVCRKLGDLDFSKKFIQDEKCETLHVYGRREMLIKFLSGKPEGKR
jgi:hypothetical protein